jgi:hypothetical protein
VATLLLSFAVRTCIRSLLALCPLAVHACYEEGHSAGLPCTVDEGCDGDYQCIEGFCLKAGQSVLDGCGDGEQKKAEFCYPRDQRIEVDLPPVTDRFLAVGDFNGDALPDFVALEDNKIFTAIFDGGAFTRTQVFEQEEVLKLYGISAGDLDGNGTGDILILTDGDDFRLQTNAWLGDGSGTGFTLVQSNTFAAGEYTPGAIGDFTGDGLPDVFTVERNTGGIGQLAPGTGGGSFGAAAMIGAGTNTGDRLQAVDLQGDGVQDVVYLQRNNDLLTVLFAIPTTPAMREWTLSTALQLKTGSLPNDVVVRDLDGDGIQDLVVSHADAAEVLVWVGDFTREQLYVANPERFDTPAPGGAVMGDLDGDEEVDLAAAGGDASFFRPGWGFLDFGVPIEPGELRNVARMRLIEANTDGVPDLLVYEPAQDNRFRAFLYIAKP